MENLFQIVFFVLIGILFRLLTAFPPQTAEVLNLVAMYFSLPALILLKVPQLSLSVDTNLLAVFPYIMLIFSAGLILIVSKLFRWPDKVAGLLLMVVPLGNTGFLGVPMIRTFFSEIGLPYLIVYDQVGTLIILISYGSLVLARYRSEGKVSHPGLLRQSLSFPPMVAASAMAVTAKMDAELAVALAGLGLLFSLVTLPSLYFLL